jgi:hypothetical protein
VQTTTRPGRKKPTNKVRVALRDRDDGKIGKVRARWGDSAVGKDDNRRDWGSASATIRLERKG